ncbi:MAG TPA: MBL fold metallo-hydrolase [Candidatus Obscuribacter sp.]|nr:MBL fold metallo-hydrolase [Candidatus Obscuribacter sp.]
MYFQQFYLGCLAHGSYLIGSEGEAAVIDPQRDVDQYIEAAEKAGLAIKYIFETHLHADFVSGHKELSERTGADIVFGAKAGAAFPHIAAHDGDIFRIGEVCLTVLETPGHTPESICILAKDTASSKPEKLFSGDTLFIGDVGRPDLVGSKGYSAEEMAALMYDSLHEKLLNLPDDVEVYPAHGAGSLCGKQLSDERSSSIGQQKKFNYALQPMSKEAFVEVLTADQPEVPAYFPKDVELNRLGAVPLKELALPRAMTASETLQYLEKGAVVLDVRSAAEYSANHIEGALNIGLGGQFASWAGTLIELGTAIVVVANTKFQVEEAVLRLARVGIESVVGYLENGMDAWIEAGYAASSSSLIGVAELLRLLEAKNELLVIDVRRRGEFASGHVPGAMNIPLSELPEQVSKVPAGCPLAVICAAGYRSTIAKGILERQGLKQLMNVKGGTAAWKSAGYPLQEEQGVPA